MAFVVEDGTGLSNANAYIAVAFADAWFLDVGDTSWTGSDAVKEQAIVRATRYIDTVFAGRVLSTPLVSTQALLFPRVQWEGVPVGVQRATAEYARRALTAALLPDPTVDASGTLITKKREKVGPIEEETEFAASLGLITILPYPSADALLQPYLRSGGRVIRN